MDSDWGLVLVIKCVYTNNMSYEMSIEQSIELTVYEFGALPNKKWEMTTKKLSATSKLVRHFAAFKHQFQYLKLIFRLRNTVKLSSWNQELNLFKYGNRVVDSNLKTTGSDRFSDRKMWWFHFRKGKTSGIAKDCSLFQVCLYFSSRVFIRNIIIIKYSLKQWKWFYKPQQ